MELPSVMEEGTPQPIYLKDYRPPDFLVDQVDLKVDLDETVSTVSARLALRRNHDDGRRPLVLDGQSLELRALRLDGGALDATRYAVDADSLTLFEVPDRFVLDIETAVCPKDNTSLEGLYVSGGVLCTQCEAEGFRKITYFPDRPDVMARYGITIRADRDRFPVMLANGNRVDGGPLPGGRHWVRWEDPYPKPSYLFALVAGRLACVEDSFITRSGRSVALRVFVEPGNEDKCAHALLSLKRAMRWDEDVFGLEYDLDVYMIVAVGDFNMGAMENKGLNIFNAKYVLAKPETATDADFADIEGVIGHEYFHNWTGNRITCRDWFQLSLKEGLTVFRDQLFSADMRSAAVKRIQDVRALRASQFQEDGGPMAHPVRPASYIEINNFYTHTVYDKGAEVVRMIHRLAGPEGFRQGVDLYVHRHDGMAVTTDNFVAAMADAAGIDLGQFRLWYDQAGTPELTVTRHYDAAAQTYTLEIRQSCPPTPGQPDKRPFHIPLAVALLGPDGGELPLRLKGENAAKGTTRVLELRREREAFTFVDVPAPPVPSLLRGFSAPVKLNIDLDDGELAFLMAHDSDPFNRWEAGQRYAAKLLLGLVADIRGDRPLVLDQGFVEAFRKTLTDDGLDPAFVALALTLPDEADLAEQMAEVDVVAIHEARLFARRAVASALAAELLAVYRANRTPGPYMVEPGPAGKRSLKNLCLAYLAIGEDDGRGRELALAQFRRADSMTDAMASLALIADIDRPERAKALAAFHARWRDEPLVVDKWFAIQARSRLPGTLDEVRRLMDHPAFSLTNPNKVRALIGSFAYANQRRFHDESGAGYRFLADQVLRLDAINPQVAARLLGPLTRHRRYDPVRRTAMRAELERIRGRADLSPDVYEIVTKSLD
jgi:aminopeptidase N